MASAALLNESVDSAVIVSNDNAVVAIPSWVCDLTSFRRWADSDEFPEDGRICFLKAKVWVDMSKEQLLTHAQVKTEFGIVVGGLVRAKRLGLYLVDGGAMTNESAGISCKPDGVFVSEDSLLSSRVRMVEGIQGGLVELEGAPDMVLEVISTASIRKDTIVLRQGYWEAGIREYWLADVRSDPLQFDILRHTANGYVETRKSSGWVKSTVFGKAFRLTQRKGLLGHPEFVLDVR